jgi:protein-disulfide isomerase/uncharacterized membrane protein
MTRTSKQLCWGLVILCLAGAVFSILSLDSFLGQAAKLRSGGSFCNISATVNCDAVNASKWSTIFGFPLAAYGFGFYLSFAFFAVVLMMSELLKKYVSSEQSLADCLLVASFGSVLYSLFLFLVSHFVIGSICLICIGMYLVNIGLFVVVSRMYTGESLLKRIISGLSNVVRWPLQAFWLLPVQNEGEAPRVRMGLLVGLFLTLGIYAFSLVVPPTVVLARLQANYRSAHPVDEAVAAWRAGEALDFPEGGTSPLDRIYFKGKKDAPIELIEFFDYECPACRGMSPLIEKLYEDYGDKLRITLRNFPLDNTCNAALQKQLHESACFAAELVRCAGEQEKFWEAHRMLFELPELGDGEPLVEVQSAALKEMGDLGADVPALHECLESDRQMPAIKADITVALKNGVGGTPKFFINKKTLPPMGLEGVKKIFDAIIQDESAQDSQ